MNTRQRILGILRYEAVDSMPAVHFGYWKELLAEWADAGHISREIAEKHGDGNEYDKQLDKMLGWDTCWTAQGCCRLRLMPAFEHKIIERLPGGFLRIQNSDGLIERVKEGTASIPSEDDYQLKDREAFEALYKEKMQFSPTRVSMERINSLKNYNYDLPLGLNIGSLFGDIRNMLSVVGMSYLMCDDYDLLGEIVDTYAEMQYQTVKTVLESGVKFDFAHYWEDICFKNGPLLSPDMFDELCAKHYKKRNDLCHQYGIDLISLDCDGVIDKLSGTWYDNGVNIMFPLEVGVWGDQFEALRAKHGSGLLGVGSMDKTALRKDRAAVDAEIERMQKLTNLGGFLPCPDHRLMPGTKWDLVKYYVEKIKTIKPYIK